MQREQERERRRMQDRQRRESMSFEEREKHLARRRRNYQLRRQRAQSAAKLESHNEQTSTAASSQIEDWNDNQSSIADSGNCVQSVGAVHVGFTKTQEKLNAGTKSQGAEAGPHKSAKFPSRLRLNQIRHLARLLNSPINEPHGESQQIGAGVITKEIVTTNLIFRLRSIYSYYFLLRFYTMSLQVGGCGSGRSRKMLRLTHLKHLSRTLNSNIEKTTDQNHFSETQVNQSLPQGESQQMNSDFLENMQSNNANDENQ